MLIPLAYGLAVVLDLFVVFIGLRFFFQPRAAAAGYGVPAKPDGDSAYLTVKGLRDLVSGLLGLALLAFSDAAAAAWFMLVISLTPLGDTVIVLRNGGTKAAAFGIHAATAAVVLVSAALLFAV
ncbi:MULTISPECIES: DUF4267 domain-containing protein [Streptomyces]|uniref:Small membrane hydrophobic protein n=1 Tax=Streptomyces qinglanensis TaxID=943816 RepID=A0A1E7K0U4_9ACTN|nr:DUF4267 domain-containing protein [Streptomyces qinglanensis]MBE9498765.1 DUF4267 domain-containing protein [Streptomyces sp. GKU 257-1]OEU97551.1 hypothetical protein AN217_06345 [Streptomyces qinglanensis]OEV25590.1 hypothetical protein AN220_12915 [Streptomyces nanshensis]